MIKIIFIIKLPLKLSTKVKKKTCNLLQIWRQAEGNAYILYGFTQEGNMWVCGVFGHKNSATVLGIRKLHWTMMSRYVNEVFVLCGESWRQAEGNMFTLHCLQLYAGRKCVRVCGVFRHTNSATVSDIRKLHWTMMSRYVNEVFVCVCVCVFELYSNSYNPFYPDADNIGSSERGYFLILIILLFL